MISRLDRSALWSAAGIAVTGVAFAHALASTWMKWGDPVVDGGREMMMPARMLAGELLYVHQRNVYGPLAPYANMLLYRAFGVHLSVLQAAGAASAAMMAVVLWLLVRRLADRVAATLVAIGFLYAFAFAHLTPNPSFNFVVPYAYAATYGMVAATVGLLFLVRHLQEGEPRDLALAVAGLVLAAVSKVEALLPAVAAHGVFLAISLARRRLRAWHLVAYGAGVAVVGGIYVALLAQVGAGLWSDNLATLGNVSILAYARETMGLDNPLRSLAWMGASAAMLGVCTGAGVSAALLLRRRAHGPASTWALALVAGGLALIGYAGTSPDLHLRALPLLTVAALAFWGVRALRAEPREDALARAVVWAFAAGCLLRLGLHARASHYGFFLAPVPFAVLAVLLLHDIPGALARAGAPRLPARAAGVGVVVGFVVGAFALSYVFWGEHDMNVRTPRGRMILRGERWQPDVVRFLARLPADASVAPVPQGAGLLFLAGVRMKGSLYFYAPMEFSGRHTDAAVVRGLAADPPSHVLLLAQQPGSFRYTGFGVEFGFLTASWIAQNYVAIAGNDSVMVLSRAPGHLR